MSYSVTLHPSLVQFEVREGETILEGALRSNKSIPYSCKDGACGTCKCQLAKGSVDFPDVDKSLSPDEKSAGYILTCLAKPKNHLVIESDYLAELEGITEVTLPCKVNSINFPSKDIAVVQFRLPVNAKLDYLAGQYIDLIYKGDKRSYSIANLYSDEQNIELHIRKVPSGLFSELVFNQCKVGDLFRLVGPYGTFFVRDSIKPIVFVAGGTGFAPVKAMVESLIRQHSTRAIYIYWGCQKEDHFYTQIAEAWQKEHSHIVYIPVLSGDLDKWKGRKGLVHKAVLEDIDDIGNFDVYVCGSPLMVNATKESFFALGLPESQFYSDTFTSFKKTG